MSMESHVVELERKHRALDQEIEFELARPNADSLKVATLKRRKLVLKDTINKLKKDLGRPTMH